MTQLEPVVTVQAEQVTYQRDNTLLYVQDSGESSRKELIRLALTRRSSRKQLMRKATKLIV